MKSLTSLLNHMTKSFLAYLVMMIAMGLTAFLIYQLEDMSFTLLHYEWKGPYDGIFWLLGLIEILLGWWLLHVFSSNKVSGSLRNLVPLITGTFLGVFFSGFWKILLLSGYIFISFFR